MKEIVKEKGFTLIEVMVALIIFSIGIIAVITLQISAVKANSNSYYYDLAINSMNNRIEKIIAQNYENLVSQPKEIPDFSNPQFMASWKVTGDSPEPGIKQIDIVVKWTKDSKKHELVHRFYKKEY
ncbi:MAG: prepilin-type N-terminal cleavage/methylation domain-containing protein [Desulforegulaceae bacterium]|nr:prepilin-type N-terminal cleavage/methylation domain-containing protein [Desulforegulaceae bacterium]